MSKLLKKDHSPLKFDTSLANLNCFIRTKSKQKYSDLDHHPRNHKTKRKTRNEHLKNIEFQDKAFLQSVVCKILNDVDCQGITELIDNMVFPSTNSQEGEAVRDNRKEQLEQQEISQIFCDFPAFNRPNYPPNIAIYDTRHQLYSIVAPPQYSPRPHSYNPREEKQDRTTTVHSSISNSFCLSPREGDTNPQIQMLTGINQLMPLGYGYGYYPQPNSLYQRQVSQRKRRTVSGEEAVEYRIMPDRIQTDGRTTLMIRHIPNKYSEEMLLEQIGKNHRLHINFLYLPIDHFNSCNVGYAFANFIHTKFIYQFYREFNGRRWDRFNSEKICQLAYARIQGTTNLMDHFQNSSGQVRGRTVGKSEQRKKSSVELDDDAIKDINKILDHQRVEQN